MIELAITEEQRREAAALTRSLPNLRNSITKMQGAYAGFLGEIVARDYLGLTQANTYDYDLTDANGVTYDVKTKRTNYAPKLNYDQSVADFNNTQKCDYYLFVRVLNSNDKAWILGKISPKEFYEKARHYKKGDVDPSNNFTFHADCHNIAIKDLTSVE